MGDMFFVAKCFALTLFVVIVLQIKVGSQTLESHTVDWIHRSGFIHQLQDVAEGAVKAGKKGSSEVASLFEDSKDEIAAQTEEPMEASRAWIKTKHRWVKQKTEKFSEE